MLSAQPLRKNTFYLNTHFIILITTLVLCTPVKCVNKYKCLLSISFKPLKNAVTDNKYYNNCIGRRTDNAKHRHRCLGL